jgi:hypothetical protein
MNWKEVLDGEMTEDNVLMVDFEEAFKRVIPLDRPGDPNATNRRPPRALDYPNVTKTVQSSARPGNFDLANRAQTHATSPPPPVTPAFVTNTQSSFRPEGSKLTKGARTITMSSPPLKYPNGPTNIQSSNRPQNSRSTNSLSTNKKPTNKGIPSVIPDRTVYAICNWNEVSSSALQRRPLLLDPTALR